MALNVFYIRIEDNDGIVPNATFSCFATQAAALAGTPTTTVKDSVGNTLSQPIAASASGEKEIYTEALETIYVKVTNSSTIVPVRCANSPELTDYSTATPVDADSFIFADANDNNLTKRVTMSDLKTALGIGSGGGIVGAGTYPPQVITVSASSPVAPTQGDLWIDIS